MTDSKQGGVAAFFDVDGTLLRVHSGSLYVADLRRRGLLSRSDYLWFLWLATTYHLGYLSMARLGRVAGRFLRGRPESEVLEHCRQWYEADVRSQLNDSVVALVGEHLERGHTVALLTAGTKYLSNLLAADLDIDHVIATELEVENGVFTGGAHLPLCYGSGKIARAETFARERGVDLRRSYFYSDSISDLPMLLHVGEPRVVSPDPRLRREAARRGWEVME